MKDYPYAVVKTIDGKRTLYQVMDMRPVAKYESLEEATKEAEILNDDFIANKMAAAFSSTDTEKLTIILYKDLEISSRDAIKECAIAKKELGLTCAQVWRGEDEMIFRC